MEYSNIHPIQDAINTIIPNSKDKKKISNIKLFSEKKTLPPPAPAPLIIQNSLLIIQKNNMPPKRPSTRAFFNIY